MTFRPRLIALDVDGTLVNETNDMSRAVRSVVRAIRDTGIKTVISTGRAIPGVMDTAAKLGFDDGYAIASNGSVVFEYDPVNVLHSVTFDASVAVRRVLEHIPDALVGVEELGVGYRVSRPFPDGEINGHVVVEDVEALIAEPVTRVIIRAPDHTAEEFSRLVDDLGLADTNYYIGYTAWLDLAPDGVSKASGLEYLCDRLDIDRSDVLAVGDGNNDCEMLLWAGRGVAMGQAPESIKVVADAITGRIDEDGLVQELQRYL